MWCTQLLKRTGLIKTGNILMRRTKSRFVDGGEHANHNDLPIPCGDFYDAWNKKNSRYNMILITGFLSAVVASALFFGSGVVYFNYGPPCLEETEEEQAQKKQKKQQMMDENMEKEKNKAKDNKKKMDEKMKEEMEKEKEKK